jgi:hypothetical protein
MHTTSWKRVLFSLLAVLLLAPARGATVLAQCLADRDNNGAVDISELICSVDNALNGCASQSAQCGPAATTGGGPVPADLRFAVIYQVSGGVRHMSVRGDGTIRDSDDPTAMVTHVATGQWCLIAPGAEEGAVGSLQNDGAGPGTILVSTGISSFCDDVPNSNITVETFFFLR